MQDLCKKPMLGMGMMMMMALVVVMIIMTIIVMIIMMVKQAMREKEADNFRVILCRLSSIA